MWTSNWLWVYVRKLFHIHSNSRSESGAELWLEGRAEFRNGSRAEFWHRGGVESGTAEVWDGVSPDIHWLRKNAGLTPECVTEVIKLFARQQSENTTNGTMWNKAAKCAAAKQVMWPPPHPAKAVEPTTASSRGKFNQYTLLAQLSDVEAQAKPLDNAMVIDEPVKPVAGSSKHPDNVDIVDGELIY